MGLVLKSNKAVNDPTGIFPIYTDFGMSTPLLSEYMANRLAAGSAVTETEFNAFKTFEQGLDSLGVKSNLLEFYPMVGGNLDAALVKFKSIENPSLRKINGLTTSNFTGKGITQVKPVAATAMPAIGANLKQKNLNTGYTAFIYYKATDAVSGQAYRYLFGASTLDSGVSDNEAVASLVDDSGPLRGKLFQAGLVVSNKSYTRTTVKLAEKIGVEGTATSRKVYDDGVLQGSTTGNVVITPSATNAEKEIYVGANNGATAGGSYFFYGELRYVLLFDGNLPDAAIPSVQSLLNDFITATGKTF